MIMIGSRAASTIDKHWPFTRRDIDLIATRSEVDDMYGMFNGARVTFHTSVTDKARIVNGDGSWPVIEVELVDDNAPTEDIVLLRELIGSSINLLNRDIDVPTLRALWLIKASHIHRPVHWQKNILHYNYLKTKVFCPLTDIEQAFLDARTKRFKVKTPRLNMSNDKFFGTSRGVDYRFIHDDVHLAVAYNAAPVYTMMKRDDSRAFCEQDMFFALPYETRLQCIREEAMVIALERHVLPGNPMSQLDAYQWAIMRICTTLTGGWFRKFALDNWSLVNVPDCDYVKRFWDNIERVRTDK